MSCSVLVLYGRQPGLDKKPKKLSSPVKSRSERRPCSSSQVKFNLIIRRFSLNSRPWGFLKLVHVVNYRVFFSFDWFCDFFCRVPKSVVSLLAFWSQLTGLPLGLSPALPGPLPSTRSTWSRRGCRISGQGHTLESSSTGTASIASGKSLGTRGPQACTGVWCHSWWA